MTYRMKKWQKISTITLLMAGVITFNDSEFRSVDKHQIAVADTNVKTTDYEKLRNTWLNVNYGYNQYDENNDAMKKKFEATEKEATNLLSSMKTESDRKYLWENSKDLDTKSADMTRTYRNIEKIAEAMKHKNTKLNTPDNKNKVKDALEWLHKNAYGKEPTDKVKELTENFKNKTSRNTNLNWWDYEIGTPRALTNTLILLNGDISSDEKKKYTAIVSGIVAIIIVVLIVTYLTNTLSFNLVSNTVLVLGIVLPVSYFTIMIRSKDVTDVERSRVKAFIPLFI